MEHLHNEYSSQQCWGLLGSINLYDCHSDHIKDPEKIQQFIDALCKEIDMKKFGPTLIQRFAEGELEGYSALQFIETSSITIHFDEVKNRAFIDIFSCKYFDYKKAEEFAKNFFTAKESSSQYLLRK